MRSSSSNSNISMVEAKLPPGFRFHPRDEELVCDYLMNKVTHNHSLLMIEVDLNKCEPWDIPESACVGGKEWYFYSQRDRKYATGVRTNRATASGYWKATGKDRPVLRKDTQQLVGMRKTLVFYQGRAPKGRKTDWVMHEFRLQSPHVHAPPQISSQKEDWVLCRVFYKNREVVTKTNMGSWYDDAAGTSSLPALMDSYITFDQTQNMGSYHDHFYLNSLSEEYDQEHDEQVSCFSIFSQNQSQTNQMFPLITPPLQYPFSSDKKVIKAVLNHLTNIDTNTNIKGSPNFGEGSSDSYLSEVGIPNNWNP